MTDRLAAIEAMLAQNPNDVFLHYSLAMELNSAGRHEQAAAEFRRCIELDRGYLAAYVEGGKALRSAGKLEGSRELFIDAQKLAAAKGDGHMADYIRQQLETLSPPGAAR